MELKEIPKQAKDFWPAFFKKVLWMVIISQLLIAFVTAAALVGFGVLSLSSPLLWLIVGLVLLFSMAIRSLIFIYIMRPTRDLMAAIIYVSGEDTSLVMPDPNSGSNVQTGFRDALQTVYELASTKRDSGPEDKDNTHTSTVTNALDMTNCGFVALDANRRVVYANRMAPVHTDVNGTRTLTLLFNYGDSLDSWLDACGEYSVHAEHVWTRVPDRLPNQEDRRFFDVIASYQKGAPTETVLTLIDRTKQYSIDEENLDFISFAAHELRGPITVIRGYLDVLNDELGGELKDDQAELFRRLIISSNRLSGYIDNILNTSKYDRRHLKMHLTEESVASIYDIIKDDMKMRADAQNRLLSVKIPDDLPKIAADRNSISEVFGNLIDNAIKYSNEGGTIVVSAVKNGDFVDISIQDHGIGMPENVVSNLFQKFYRSHRSRETVAGTGIGLYISKAIVESHGGTISVRSEDSKGSIFTVSLPIYSTVADKLQASDNNNVGMISEGTGWIKNHSMYRG